MKTYYVQGFAYETRTERITAEGIADARAYAAGWCIDHFTIYADIFDAAGRHMCRIHSLNNKRGYVLAYIPPEEKEALTAGMQEFLVWEREGKK